MKIGLMSLRMINKYYHEIRRMSQNLILYANKFDDEDECILLNVIDGCYTYTSDTIEYTISHSEEYTWYRLSMFHGNWDSPLRRL